jgi:ketosteroid isomerase-like protein
MSDENVQRAHRAVEAISRGDIEAVLEFAHRDIEWVPNAAVPGAAERYHGHDGIRRWYEEWFVEPWEHVEVELEDQLDAGNERYVFTVHVQGRGKASGIEVDMRIFDVWSFRDGKLVHRTSHMDKAEALEAAGLSE